MRRLFKVENESCKNLADWLTTTVVDQNFHSISVFPSQPLAPRIKKLIRPLSDFGCKMTNTIRNHKRQGCNSYFVPSFVLLWTILRIKKELLQTFKENVYRNTFFCKVFRASLSQKFESSSKKENQVRNEVAWAHLTLSGVGIINVLNLSFKNIFKLTPITGCIKPPVLIENRFKHTN